MTTIDTRKPQNYTIYHYIRDKFVIPLTITDQNDTAVDMRTKTLVFSIRETENGTAVDTITTDAGDITVAGVNNNVLTLSKVLTGLSEKAYYYDLDNVTDDETIMDGKFIPTYKGR